MQPAGTDEKIVLSDEAIAKTAEAEAPPPETTDEDGFPIDAPAETPKKEEPAAAPAAPKIEKESDVLDSINGLIEQIAADRAERAETKAAQPVAEVELPADIKAGLESDDPAVRGLAQRWIEQNDRQNKIEADVMAERQTRLTDKIEAQIVDCQQAYKLTDAEIVQVTERLTANPALAASLSFEDGVHLVLPGRARVATNGAGPSAAPKEIVRVNSQGTDAAKLIDRSGGPGPAPKARTTSAIPDGEGSIEQSVTRGMKELFGV